MTKKTRQISGIILLTVPTIIFGGYFLLTILGGQQEHLNLTDFQKAMFRAGHAHAGVLVILSLVIQPFVDNASLSHRAKWFARLSFPLAAIIVSMGFFAAASGEGLNSPNQFIVLIYLGALLLASALITLGIGLLRNKT